MLYTVRTLTRIARESSTCIDNFLITSEEKYKVSVVDLSLSNHFSQFLEIKAVLTKQANSPSYLIKRNFSEQNIAHFLEYLNEEQWHDVYCQVCPNKAFECFSSQMLFYYELCFPLVKININNKFKCKKVNLPPELDRLRDKVTLYNDLSKNNNKYKDISKYLNSIYKDKLKQFFVLQNDKIIQSSDNKPKAMWQIIKNLQKRDQSNQIKILDNGDIVPDNIVARNFNAHYTNIPHSDVIDREFARECVPICNNTFFLFPISRYDVLSFIDNLKNSNATGYDGISNNLLKKCKFVLCEVLCFLINLSTEHAAFPECLKLATVIPLFKKGDANQYGNYRGISLLTSISKIFEINIKNQLLSFLNKNNILSDSQHGFTESRSTESALCDFQQKIVNAVDKKMHALGLFVDFSRAFDMVNHELLLIKLERYGIRGKSWDLFKSYLNKRKQYVVVNRAKSETLLIDQGVPQGSVLGPLLYLIYSNDLISYLKNKSTDINVVSYADDTNIVITSSSQESLKSTAEQAYESILLWSQKNGLSLSQSKTNFVIFSNGKRDNSNFMLFQNYTNPLVPSSSSRMLGVNFDENLRWVNHIEDLSIKLRRNCFALKSLTNYCSQSSLLSLYYASIHSHLSYGIVNWGSSSEVTRVFLLQKYAIRIIFMLCSTDSCRDFFKEYKILTVVGLYIFKTCIFAYENKNSLQMHRSLYNYNTRNKDLLLPSSHKSTLFQKNLEYKACLFYNKLSNEIKNSASKTIFKSKLRKFLIDINCYSIAEFLV